MWIFVFRKPRKRLFSSTAISAGGAPQFSETFFETLTLS